jgi:ribosomal protein S18 acetylase RimI-like enzyme
MVIRDLAWTDFDSIVEAYYALYDEVREDPDLGVSLHPQRPTVGHEGEWFAGLWRRIDEGASLAAVAVEDGKAVGVCHVDRHDGPESRHIGVLGIMVARPWRHRGLGRQLMQYAIDRSRGRFELLELSVFVTNAPARALYRSLGFRSWGVEPKGLLRGGRYTDVEHMTLELTPAAAK